MSFSSSPKTNIRDFKEPIDAEPVSRSYFGKTMKIEGTVICDEDLTIEGKVNGEIEASKTLTIGKSGFVKGKISASIARISGEAEGFISASQKLEITSEGKFKGKMKSEKINVAEGALIKAHINVDEEPKTHTPPTPETHEHPKAKKKNEEKTEEPADSTPSEPEPAESVTPPDEPAAQEERELTGNQTDESE